MAVVLVIALATLLRLPLLAWPPAAGARSPCCGHPDEITHYDLVRAFRSGLDPGSYPPGFAVLTSLLLRTPAADAASRLLAPAGTTGEEGDRIRVVSTGRILGLAFSGAAVWLLYRLCLAAGLAPWVAAASAPMLGLAPLFSVQGTYALADVPHAALVLAGVLAFLCWDRTRSLSREAIFGFLLGGILAFKLIGAVIAFPPLVSMVVRSATRSRTAVTIAVSALAGAVAWSGGFLRFALPSSLFDTVVVQNAQASRIRPGWNAVHHVLSVLPGMGAPFFLLLVVAAASFATRAGRGRTRLPLRALDPLPAVASGALLYFLGVCFSSNPFTRHMLPVYPLLVLFVLLHAIAPQTDRVPPGKRLAVAVLLFVSLVTYGALATRPVLRSFAEDPLDRAAAWVRANTEFEPRVPPFRNFPPVPSARAGTGAPEGSAELAIVHSAWLGRLTGSWWLKPAPAEPRDVYHFDGSFEEVRSWQRLMAGEPTQWRVRASFGEDWNTPERLFLALVGRGYDQFVTAGRAYVVTRNGSLPAGRSR